MKRDPLFNVSWSDFNSIKTIHTDDNTESVETLGFILVFEA